MKILLIVLLVLVAVVWAAVRIADGVERLRRAQVQAELDRWRAERWRADDPNTPPGGAA